MNITKSTKFTRVSNSVAGGLTTINSSSVDMSGYGSVTFAVAFGAINVGSVTDVRAQQSSDNSTFNDLAGTKVSIADTDDNKLVLLEINEPTDRYLRCVVTRATANSAVDSIVAIQSRPSLEPTTQDVTTVAGTEFHHAPAEGTA